MAQGTGEDDEDVVSSASTLVHSEDGFQPVFFDPRPLKNLLLVDEMPSLMPITDMKVRQRRGSKRGAGAASERFGGTASG